GGAVGGGVGHAEPVPRRRRQRRIPRDLETICLKAMAKRPAQRYATAEELAADLTRFLDGEPIRARASGPLRRCLRWCRRNPVVAGLSALVFLLLAAVAGSALYAERSSRREALLQQAQRIRMSPHRPGWSAAA